MLSSFYNYMLQDIHVPRVQVIMGTTFMGMCIAGALRDVRDFLRRK